MDESSTCVSVLASTVYLSLLLASNAPVFTLFNPMDFLSFLRCVRRFLKQRPQGQQDQDDSNKESSAPKRKRTAGFKGKGLRKRPRQSSSGRYDDGELDARVLYPVLERLEILMSVIHLDRFPDSLKSLIETVIDIPVLALEICTNLSIYSKFTDFCSRILSAMLRPEDGDLSNTAVEVIKSLSPLILNHKDQARAFALEFVTIQIGKVAKESDGVKSALVNLPRYLVQKAPEKSEPRSLFPGFGGTQRLPRLVGLPKALEMMLTSKPVKGEEAFSLGLVDAIVSREELISAARKWALDISERRKPWIISLHKTNKLESLADAREIFKFARAQVRKQAPNLKHPLVCIDVVETGVVSGPRAGLQKEIEDFQVLLHADTSKSLIHVFFAQRGTTKVPGVSDLGLTPRRINKVAVIGGGLMGSGIATALILSNYPVILKEVNEKFLEAGLGRVKANLQSRVRKGTMTPEKFERTISLLKGVLDYESFKDVDMVIEAVIENISLKQQIIVDLEKYCPPHCILATNTSTIDLDLIGEKTNSHDRIVGAHFFSPAHIMPLLEVVRTNRTAPQVIVDLVDVGKRIKKTPVVVGNCTGFAVNRMFFPYTQAALLLVEHGVDPYQIDRAIYKFGMPMGPFRLIDLVGFGVAIATGGQFVQNFPDRTFKSMIIPLMQEDKRAGETTQKGFYLYDKNRKSKPDPELKKYIEKARSMSGISVDPKLAKISDKDIIEMIFFPVVNEACRVLAEGIAVKAADLDIAGVMGMGFPPYRGGVMFWADSLGSKYIYSRLEEWSKLYGGFFKPCAYLAERAAQGSTLSSPSVVTKSRL